MPYRFCRVSFAAAASALLLAGSLVSGSRPADAQVYVASEGNANNGSIREFSLAGADQGAVATGLAAAEDLAFDAGGNLYVAEFGANRVARFAPDGTPLGIFAAAGLIGPTGLAFDTAGNLYIANQLGGNVRRYSPAGVDLGNFVTGLASPYGLAFDAAGNLYVANRGGNGDIVRFDPGGNQIDLGAFATPGGSAQPTGLTFDASGNLYASLFLAHTVRRYSPAGVDLGDFAATGLLNPVDMQFLPNGDLLVANFGNNTVRRFSSTGTDLGNFAAGGDLLGPTGLALRIASEPIAAPEPAAFALFAAGLLSFAGAAAMSHRRRNKA